jgi:hypothetical protein
MPTIRVTVQVEVDDVPIVNFPLFYRATPTLAMGLSKTQVSGAPFVSLPDIAFSTLQQAIIQSDQQVSIAFNGVTASPITLTAGGIMVLDGTSLTALSIQNLSGQTATMRGFIGGV